jgi:hypothetical protein
MKTLICLSFFIVSFSFFGQSVYSVNSKYDLIVYKCSSKYDATDNKGLWYFTSSKYDAKKKIYFCDSKYDADLIIYFASSKYDAQWRNSGKKSLMY